MTIPSSLAVLDNHVTPPTTYQHRGLVYTSPLISPPAYLVSDASTRGLPGHLQLRRSITTVDTSPVEGRAMRALSSYHLWFPCRIRRYEPPRSINDCLPSHHHGKQLTN